MLLRPDSATSTRSSRPPSAGSSRPTSARTISRRASVEVLSDAGTPRIKSIEENEEDSDNEEDDKEKHSDAKSDSGAGDSDASTIGKGDKDEDQPKGNGSHIIAAAVAAPSIAAGGTVFATASKRSKSRKQCYI